MPPFGRMAFPRGMTLGGMLRTLHTINHPRYTESIDQHSETRGPESLLYRHLYFSAFLQRVKKAFRFRRIIVDERHGESFRFAVAVRGTVRGHQNLVPYGQAGMKNLVAPFRGHLLLRRRPRVGHHHFDLAAKTFLIEL